MKEQSRSLRTRLIIGTAWMVMMRWTIRGIGLISTIILARLLEPSDFGLVAMAGITIGLVEVLLSFGVDMALIQQQSKSREDFDSAWTLRLCQGFFAATLIVISIPLAVRYFQEPRLQAILWTMVIGILVRSMSNIGTVLFRVDLEFDKEFRFEVLKKIVAFVVATTAAVILRNYWALVIGIMIGNIINTLISYFIHPYRPRLCLSAIPKLWSFSQWMLLINIGYYLETRTDELIIGGHTNSDQMGLYNVGSEIAQLPSTEIAMPLSRTLIPGYARLQDEASRLKAAFVNAFGMIVMISAPVGVGLALVAKNAVILLLGNKWAVIIPIIQVLALHGLVRVNYGSIMNLLMATGAVRVVAIVTWLSMIVFFVSATSIIGTYGLMGVAVIKLALNLGLLAIAIHLLSRYQGIRAAELFAIAYRPLTATLVMTTALWWLPSNPTSTHFVNLVYQIATGAIVYTLAITLLWRIMKCPHGSESFVYAQIAKYFKIDIVSKLNILFTSSKNR